MADELRNVTVGFEASMPLEMRITREAYDDLRKALADDRSQRWHELKTQTSDIALDLSKVTFVRIETEEHRVGF